MMNLTKLGVPPPLSIHALEQARVYELLRAILVVSLGLTLLFMAALLITQTGNALTYILGVVILLAQVIVLRAVTPAQASRFGWGLSTAFWIVTTAGTLLQSLPPTAAALSYVMIVLLSGLLLGGRASGLFATLSVGALGGLFWLTDRGVLPPYSPGNFHLEAIWLMAVICQSALVLALAHRSIQQSFRHARQAQHSLESQNARLEQEIAGHRQTQAQLLETERARAELEKERAVVETRHRFISMVSHEFRTPLSIILSSKDMLQLYADRMDANGREAHFKKISEQVSFMAEMLNDVMMVSKSESKLLECSPAPLDLGALLQGAIQQAERQAGKSAHTFHLNNSLPAGNYLLDAKLLKHILYNLLSNAVKYSPEGGLIKLDARAADGQIELQVSDSGIGIPDSHLPHLFETFQRAENVGEIQGTGLGLAIVKSGVEAHGGSISVKSAAGQGTTFTVRLPLRREALPALAG
jgi:signal transduction histidine kinase